MSIDQAREAEAQAISLQTADRHRAFTVFASKRQSLLEGN